MRRTSTHSQVAEYRRLPAQEQRRPLPLQRGVSSHVGETEKLAMEVNLHLWHLVLQLHAILEADSDAAARVLVKSGLLLRMDEMAALRKAVEGALS